MIEQRSTRRGRIPEPRMLRSWLPLVLVALAAACGDSPLEPPPAPVRTVLLHQLYSSENELVNTDGSGTGLLSEATRGMLPIGAFAPEGVVALLSGNAIVLTTIANPIAIDTVISPAPSSHSLASFSNDGTLMAVVAYAPTPSVLVYDRVNHRIDTLALNGADPVLPPVFSPDGRRIVVFSVNPISLLVTTLYRFDRGRFETQALWISKFINRPLFGWPRWTRDGVLMAFRRVAEKGPDTLVVGIIHPEKPHTFFDEAYRAVLAPVSDQRPELDFGIESTYAMSSDGLAVVLGALPGSGIARPGVYLVTSGVDRVQLVLDSPDQFPVFPLFIRE
jgi:hypothetical protein